MPSPRELLTIEAIKQAEDDGQLFIEKTNIVVNMLVLVWPGGPDDSRGFG